MLLLVPHRVVVVQQPLVRCRRCATARPAPRLVCAVSEDDQPHCRELPDLVIDRPLESDRGERGGTDNPDRKTILAGNRFCGDLRFPGTADSDSLDGHRLERPRRLVPAELLEEFGELALVDETHEVGHQFTPMLATMWMDSLVLSPSATRSPSS